MKSKLKKISSAMGVEDGSKNNKVKIANRSNKIKKHPSVIKANRDRLIG